MISEGFFSGFHVKQVACGFWSPVYSGTLVQPWLCLGLINKVAKADEEETPCQGAISFTGVGSGQNPQQSLNTG